MGRERCARELANAPGGHRALIAWALRAAPGARRFGVECSGSLGRALALALMAAGEVVVKVPAKLTERERGRMRGRGRSDPRDALGVARATLREGERLPALGALLSRK